MAIACSDVVKRGEAFADGKVFYKLLDGHTDALHSDTGKLLWQTRRGNIAKG